MSYDSFFNLTSLGTALVAFLLLRLMIWRQRVQKLPPGPPKLPIIGNLLNMPSKLDGGVFMKMAKEYDSPIIHLGVLGQSIVILNSFDVAKELLDKRSTIYSTRPRQVMLGELAGWGSLITFTPYNDAWRTDRRFLAKYLEAARSFSVATELTHARRLLLHLLDNPEELLSHLRHTIGSIIIETTYGIKVQPSNDPYIKLSEEAVDLITKCAFDGPYLPDIFPWARRLPSWLPGLAFPALAEESRKNSEEFMDRTFDASREIFKSGKPVSSLIGNGLEDLGRVGEDSAEMRSLKTIAASAYLGGADTSPAAVGFLLLAVTKYPEVQRKIQEELDAAVQGKLPELADIWSLPYLTATVMETYRWKPLGPLGVPHCTTEDDIYEGYYIPSNSTVLFNVDAMMYDEADYPEPHLFRPERFLKGGKINEDVRNPMDILFGFGRRICPGRERAHATVLVTAASILSTFNLEMKRDQNGVPIEPTGDYIDGIARIPAPFDFVLKPRSKATVDLIQNWAASEDSE